MASDAFLIAKLQMRRARSWTSRAFALTGSNPFRDKTFMDRAYQVYALLVVAVALALIWVMALAQIESVFSLMPPEAAELTLRAVLAAASLAFCVLGVRALDRGPFSFSNADIAYLVTSRVDLGLVLLSGFAASLARALIVGAFAGVAFGVAAGAAGSSVSLVVSAVVFASMFGSVAGAPWAIGAARVRRASPRRGSSSCASLLLDRGWRRWVAKGLVALIAISLTFLSMTSAPGFLAGPFSCWLGPSLCILIVAESVLVLLLGRRADSSEIAQETSLSYGTRHDMFTSLSIAATFGTDAIKEERRRAKVVRRRPIFALPQSEGAAAIFSRAALSVARQREGWPLLVAAGAVVAPFGAFAVSSGPNPVFLILWLFVLQKSARSVREISRPFADDLRIRTIRDNLPFRTRTIFVLGSLPGFIVALSAQILVLVIVMLLLGPMGIGASVVSDANNAGILLLLAPLTLVGMAMCCAFDAARSFFRQEELIGYELPAFVFAGIPSLMAMMGATSTDVLIVVAILDLALGVLVFDRVG